MFSKFVSTYSATRGRMCFQNPADLTVPQSALQKIWRPLPTLAELPEEIKKLFILYLSVIQPSAWYSPILSIH